MLPPPPEEPLTFIDRTVRLVQHPTVATGSRVLLFLAKLLSLTVPCSPYATSAWVLYPLLALAALDLGLLSLHLREELLFTVLHFGIVAFAIRQGRLCQTSTLSWDEL
jgi:hypothetical protein